MFWLLASPPSWGEDFRHISGGFCIGQMPLSYIFRGGAVRFSFFLVAVWLLVLFLVVCWALPFW